MKTKIFDKTSFTRTAGRLAGLVVVGAIAATSLSACTSSSATQTYVTNHGNFARLVVSGSNVTYGELDCHGHLSATSTGSVTASKKKVVWSNTGQAVNAYGDSSTSYEGTQPITITSDSATIGTQNDDNLLTLNATSDFAKAYAAWKSANC